jgi:hypothetical protein
MNPNGQVDIRTEFGQLLSIYAELPEIQMILEVGTWKGNGTTACVVDGIRKKLEKQTGVFCHFFSIESNLKFLMEANALWMPKALPFLQLMYGRLHTDGLLTREQVEANPKFGDVVTHYNLWYEQDVRDYRAAPLIESKFLPSQIHMIVLDGGEFSGYADWEALKKKNPVVVALDDTNVMKNAKVYEELSTDPAWEKRHGNNDRHGWAIFVRKV